MHYQPLRALTSTGVGSVTGYEALARWRHPRRGLLPAGEFIDLAEESGLVHPLGAAVLDQVEPATGAVGPPAAPQRAGDSSEPVPAYNLRCPASWTC